MFDLTTEQFAGYFPEFNQIVSEELRGKVIRIWQRAAKESNWGRIEDVPFSPDYPAEPNTFLQHVKLVTAYSYAIALKNNELEGTKVDLDTVIAGALLHDVCKLVEYSSKGGRTLWGQHVTHGIYGIVLCREEHVPLEIIHVIASHTAKLSMNNKSREAIIIAKCDSLAAACVHLYESTRL